MTRPLVLISAGGTGGHLFPAFALCEELKRRDIDSDLVTDVRADQYGIVFPGRDIHRVPSATLRGKSPVALAKLGFTLLRGTIAAWRLIRGTRPKVAVGFGGYPTLPPLMAARLSGVPTLIHDANAVMGRANRLLARFADTIALAFDKTSHVRATDADKVRLVGMPVRDAVLAARKPYRGRSAADRFNLLVFGGSQGAHAFAEIVPKALIALPQAIRARLKLVQQVREEDMDAVRAVYDGAGLDVELANFFSDLPERMASADLVIARAGASSVAELTVLGRPSILVPFPHALDNDQLQNATRLQDAGAAQCIEQVEFTPELLAERLTEMANEPEQLARSAEAALAMGMPDAVQRLADEVEALIKNKDQG